MTDIETSDIFAVVLAAGSASRFGSVKQLAEIDGVPLVHRAVRAATEVCGDRTALIAGHAWKAVSEACVPLPGFLIVNENHADGLGTSIAAAVRSVRHATQAVVVLLADQAMITAQHIQALCDAWSGADDEIVATEYAGKVGVFEGAMYVAKGLYRPSVDCLMFEMTEARFCPVCSQAIERIIDLYTR